LWSLQRSLGFDLLGSGFVAPSGRIGTMNTFTGEPMPDAGQVAAGLGATWALIANTLQQGWSRRDDGIYTMVTGVPVASLNGVWVVGEEVDAEAVDAGLALVAQSAVPFCLETRPNWREAGAAIAAAHGLTASDDIPLMATAGPVNAPVSDRLSIRELDSGEAQLHCDVAGPAFGAPPDLLAQLITTEVLGRPEVRGLVGEVEGERVVTAMSIALADGVGIFNVATPEPHRGHGYGAAITARAASDGFAGGARWAWLQSTEAGYRVYQRLGFTTLEEWPSWISRA
jgi:N-acetylglutamate synthase